MSARNFWTICIWYGMEDFKGRIASSVTCKLNRSIVSTNMLLQLYGVRHPIQIIALVEHKSSKMKDDWNADNANTNEKVD